MSEPSASKIELSARRGVILCAVLVACCLLSDARLIHDAWRLLSSSFGKANEVSARSDERFANIRKALPSRGVIGYINSHDRNVVDATADYYLAQYALAPLVLDRNSSHDFVIGNFPDTDSSPATLPQGLHLVRDFGDGVLLLAADSQQKDALQRKDVPQRKDGK